LVVRALAIFNSIRGGEYAHAHGFVDEHD